VVEEVEVLLLALEDQEEVEQEVHQDLVVMQHLTQVVVEVEVEMLDVVLVVKEVQESLSYQHQELKSLPASGHCNVNTITRNKERGHRVLHLM